jgi:integrase
VATVGAPAFVLDVLQAHRDRQLFPGQADQVYVFTGASGRPLDPDAVSHALARLLARKGLRPRRFHDLRHAAASLHLAQGAELWQVSKLLRHSGVAITADIYGHMYTQTSRELADRMGRFLEQARFAGEGRTDATTQS